MDAIEGNARALRWNAAFVGTAFIVATAAGVAAAAIGRPLLEAPDYRVGERSATLPARSGG